MGPKGHEMKQPILRLAALLLLAVVSALLPQQAFAGRRPFMWVWDSEVLGERGVELEQWVTERNLKNSQDSTAIWFAPVLGITDQLELALPFEWVHRQGKDATQLDWYGAELRWRLAPADKLEAGPWAPLVRLAVQRPVRDRDVYRVEANAVLSWDPAERWHATADLGLRHHFGADESQVTYAAGVSARLLGELRLGAEWFGRHVLVSTDGLSSFNMVGPNLGWTHGRLWVTAGWMVGLDQGSPNGMGRLLWAIAF